MSTDALSEVLRAVRLNGAVFFAVDAGAPWVAESPPAERLGPYLLPGVEHVIEYHLVKAGSCWGGIVGEEPLKLETGDIIVFPQGDAHVLSSEPGMRGNPDDVPVRRAQTARLPISVTINRDGAERAELVCGFLGCDARPFNPLLAALPRVIHLRRNAGGDPVLEHLIGLALVESSSERAGGACMLSRLSELLFVEVVRRHLATLPAENVGWLAGLRDENIGRVLGKIHDRPAHAWNLDDLAREVGLSRSVLAERFTHLVGVPPMQYLTRWRMQLAASLLSSTSLNLFEIADRVGYGSETALSRAYKRYVGVAPAEWRKTRRPASVPLDA
ncbi:MAG TPA: AraC family transcriptional regulator [Polyangiaceae bacterium]